MLDPNEIIQFWFVGHGAANWWSVNADFDREIAEKFADTHARLAAGEGFSWRGNAAGRLAEIIVLDQFSRNLFRNDPRAFASDGMALVLAQEAVAGGHDRLLDGDKKCFLYMPFMHSESVAVHEATRPLFAALSDAGSYLASADQHLAVLHRFGRYPKRNAALGRVSTPEEAVYLAESGSRAF